MSKIRRLVNGLRLCYSGVRSVGNLFAERYIGFFDHAALLMDASPWLVCLFAAFSVLFAATWLEMKQYQGRELNRTLGHTARNVFIYAVLLSVVLLFGS